MLSLGTARLLGLVLKNKPLTDRLCTSSPSLPSRTIADLALTCHFHVTALPSTPIANRAHSLPPVMSCHLTPSATGQLLTFPALPRATRQAISSLRPSPYLPSPLSPLPILARHVPHPFPTPNSSPRPDTPHSFTGTTSSQHQTSIHRYNLKPTPDLRSPVQPQANTRPPFTGTTSSQHPTSSHRYNLHPSPRPSLSPLTQDWASIYRYNLQSPPPRPPGSFRRLHTVPTASSSSSGRSPSGGNSSITTTASSPPSSSSSPSMSPLSLSLAALRCTCCGPVFDAKLRPLSASFTAAATSGGQTGESASATVTVSDEELVSRENRQTGASTSQDSQGSAVGAPVLQFYNTRSRKKEPFQPLVPMKVNMYVCGVTAYDYSHIGHARVYVAFDVLFRFLRHMGYDVKYVRNFTDVDDKIIARAAETGESPVALSARFCEEFRVDMAALRCLPPSVEPRVSEHIPHIIALIEQIIARGHGYVVEGGDVFFSVAGFSEYGALSGRTLDENRAGERVALDPRKRNPADFALWKSAKPGEISWDSPWGPGRPGWHIECSAMSAAHLGPELDIHGGGADLVFPHHENELAQSRAADERAGVRLWMHNGFVTVDAEKMSKSLGNFFTIREALQSYHPLALRYFLLSTQYRSPVNYSRRQLDNASDRVYYIFQSLVEVEAVLQKAAAEAVSAQGQAQAAGAPPGAGKAKSLPGTGAPPSPETLACAESFRRGFEEAMADDLSTSHAIALLSEPFRIMNEFLSTKKGRKDKARVASFALLKSAVEEKLAVLGLSEDDPVALLEELKDKGLARAGLTREGLAAAVAERVEARQAKDYQRSDEIRAELARKGILLMDGGDAMLWRPGVVEEGA